MDNELKNKLAKAVETFDTKSLVECLETAMQNDTRRLAAEDVRRAEQLDAFRAEAAPVSKYKIIALDGKVGRRLARLYVTKVSYKAGAGFAVSKLSYSEDKSRAQEFSTVAAQSVSEYLISCGYTPHLDTKEAR